VTPVPASADRRRQELVLRLAQQRGEIVALLDVLDAPIQKIDRVQRGLRQVRAALPTILIALAGLALVGMFWHRRRSAQGRGLSLVTLALSAWRLWTMWRRVAAVVDALERIRSGAAVQRKASPRPAVQGRPASVNSAGR
jgi:hypothetical protein